MRVADYIANFLAEKGVRNIFMLSGTGSIYLDDAFAHQREVKYICARHEAAAVIMATAVAKLTGNLGVVVSTTGPGATNAAAGVVEAWVDSVPVLVISGQVSTPQISGNDRTFGIQGFDVISHVDSITKYAVTVTDPLSIRYHLEGAIYHAKTGRPGPVWLDIPMDVQSSMIEVEELQAYSCEEVEATECAEDLGREVVSLMKSLNLSKRPVVIFGQGVRQSGTIPEFKGFIEKLDIPAVSARMAKDILPYSHPNYMGMGGYKGEIAPAKILKDADFILSLGTSHSVSFPIDPSVTLVCVNIDAGVLRKEALKVDVPICIDLKDFFSITANVIKTTRPSHKEWMSKCVLAKEGNPTVTKKHLYNPINSYYLLNRLDELSNDNHIFVNDAGSANYVSSQTLSLEDGQRELTSGAFYSMGLTIPLAIGAASCKPDHQIIAVTGDGSIEVNLQELQTVCLNDLNIKIFVINNGGYASIRDSQDSMCGGRYTDDEVILDFSKVANTFNMPFYFLDDYRALDDQISQIFSVDGPALIEVLCDPNQHILSPYEELD